MATFILFGPGQYQFTFINHSNTRIQYGLGPATGCQRNEINEINGNVDPGATVDSKEFESEGTLEQGDVPVITISGAPSPNFRFWSGSDGQYINVLAGKGYEVTKNTSEISEVTGNGFRITVDGGGKDDPSVSDIYIQVYNT